MENLPDYYAILQVHPRAEKEVIDAAYRKLAVRYHPDVSHSPNTADRMKQINAAYEVLSDPVKRAEYDSKRGMGPSSETANNGNSSPRSLNQAWRRFVIPVGVVVLG
ncbi:MAG: DnaJ domain-containing protein, partial [Dehalococcoidia bacterium]